MDDTSKGVGRGDEMRGRSDEDVTARGTERIGDAHSVGAVHTAGDTAAASDDVDRETREIRRDIEQTREEMSETIDAIQEKLRPANIVSNAAERAKNATMERVRHMTQSAGDAANRVMYGSGGRSEGMMGTIRENPIPAALIGIGAAWWYMSSRSRGNERYGYDARYRYRAGGDYGDREWRTGAYGAAAEGQELGSGSSAAGEYDRGYGYAGTGSGWSSGRSSEGEGFFDRVKSNPVPAALAGIGLGWLALSGRSGRDWTTYEPAYRRYAGEDEGGMLSSVSEMASNVTERVSEAASGAAESAQQMMSGARDYTRGAAERFGSRGRRGQSELQRMTRENPLAVAGGALLLGAAVGLAIPETERENELMGEARDSMIDRAQDMAQTAVSRAKDAAGDLAGEAASRIVKGEESK
jgi:hypothetical protein